MAFPHENTSSEYQLFVVSVISLGNVANLMGFGIPAAYAQRSMINPKEKRFHQRMNAVVYNGCSTEGYANISVKTFIRPIAKPGFAGKLLLIRLFDI